jgi:hypothetical protein
MSWIYVPGMEASASGSVSSPIPFEPSLTARGKPISARSWPNACKKAAWTKRLSGLTSSPSRRDDLLVSWISSLPDSLASRSRRPANEREPRTPDGSGPTSSESPERPKLGICSSRTCPACSAPTKGKRSKKSSTTWPKQAGLLNGVVCRREKSERVTREIASGSSLWPTATTCDESDLKKWQNRSERKAKEGINLQYPLSIAAQSFHSHLCQTTSKAGGESCETGPTSRRLWQTMTVQDASRPYMLLSGDRTKTKATLLGQAAGWPRPKLRLNPSFVEWLMGVPIGWTDCERSATEFTLWLSRQRSLLSGTVCTPEGNLWQAARWEPDCAGS